MEFDKKKLEKWLLEIPECKEFLSNFFFSCREEAVNALVNYKRDIEIYSLNRKSIRDNSQRLMMAFEDISGIRVNYG